MAYMTPEKMDSWHLGRHTLWRCGNRRWEMVFDPLADTVDTRGPIRLDR
jgi:hypothetical protein